jgi:hypothetical protein
VSCRPFIALHESAIGTQEPRRRIAIGSAYWGAAEIVRGGAEPPPVDPKETLSSMAPRRQIMKLALIAIGLLATTGVVYAACVFC